MNLNNIISTIRNPEFDSNEDELIFAPFWGLLLGLLAAFFLPYLRSYVQYKPYIAEFILLLAMERLKGKNAITAPGILSRLGTSSSKRLIVNFVVLLAKIYLISKYFKTDLYIIFPYLYFLSYFTAFGVIGFLSFSKGKKDKLKLNRPFILLYFIFTVIFTISFGTKGLILLILIYGFSISITSSLLKINYPVKSALLPSQSGLEFLILVVISLLGL